jgi:Acyl-CoA dehydrogenase, C-terminal domain
MLLDTWSTTAQLIIPPAPRPVLGRARIRVYSSGLQTVPNRRRFAAEICFKVRNEALQLHGDYGYTKGHPLERCLGVLRVHQILERTNEIMRVVISCRLLDRPLTGSLAAERVEADGATLPNRRPQSF